MRRIILIFIAAVIVLAVCFLLGPRVTVDTTVRFDPAVIGDDPQAYLEKSEAAIAGIRPGLAKEIIWADPASHEKTPIAIVYVHGFSASKGEVRPLADLIAKSLGANLFYTRLSGHGQDSQAMALGSVNGWINDYAEAVAIGHALGDKVVVVAMSTGAALAVLSASGKTPDGVAAMALLSPNFGVRASGIDLLTLPWGRQIAEMVIGTERSFKPRNPMQEKLWTWRYPTRALLPLAALTELARDAPVENAKAPALFIFSDFDRIVRADLTRTIAARWGGPHELVPVNESGDPEHHVIAGDAMSPKTTRYLAERIVVWIQAVLN